MRNGSASMWDAEYCGHRCNQSAERSVGMLQWAPEWPKRGGSRSAATGTWHRDAGTVAVLVAACVRSWSPNTKITDYQDREYGDMRAD